MIIVCIISVLNLTLLLRHSDIKSCNILCITMQEIQKRCLIHFFLYWKVLFFVVNLIILNTSTLISYIIKLMFCNNFSTFLLIFSNPSIDKNFHFRICRNVFLIDNHCFSSFSYVGCYKGSIFNIILFLQKMVYLFAVKKINYK